MRRSLTSRNGNDLTGRFAAVAKALVAAVRSPSAVLDGEVCALDEAGRSDFGLLQRGEGAIVFVAFDLLELDGTPLGDCTYDDRRRALEDVVDSAAGGVVLSPSFDDGAALEGGRARARPRRRRGQETELDLPTRPTVTGLAQAEAQAPPGARDRGLDARQGASQQRHRFADPRRARADRASRTPATSGRGSPTPSSTVSRLCSHRSCGRNHRLRMCCGCHGFGERT